MELNEQEALIDPDSGAVWLAVDTERDIITPEPVQASIATIDRPATLFYPDTASSGTSVTIPVTFQLWDS
jgi:hypothetical protein